MGEHQVENGGPDADRLPGHTRQSSTDGAAFARSSAAHRVRPPARDVLQARTALVLGLQRTAGNAATAQLFVQRAPPTAAPETESQALALVDPAVGRFQQAVDAVDESLIKAVGAELDKVWQRVELAKLNTSAGQPADAKDEPYDRARRAVLTGVPPVKFQGQSIGPAAPQQYEGALSEFIVEQTRQNGWAAKDAAEAVKNLRQEPISEPTAWTVIGLLRQHLNPWQFAYMVAVMRKGGVEDRLARLPAGPRDALDQLRKTQQSLAAIPGLAPGDPIGKIALAPEDNVVALVQPLSPVEAAAELYGAGSNWRDVLLPLNRSALAGASDGGWIPAGSKLHVLPEAMQPTYRVIFLAAAAAKRKAEGAFSLRASTPGPVVVGNELTLSVAHSNVAFDHVALSWRVENDPAAVRSGDVPADVAGPTGTLRWSGKSDHASWALKAAVVGNHVVHCQLTFSDGKTEDLSQTVVVMTPEERLTLEQKANTDFERSPSDLIADLKKRLASTTDPTAKAEIQKRIDGMAGVLGENKEINLRPLKGSYVSSDEAATSVGLRLFADLDRSAPTGGSTVYLRLWDFTLNGKPREYTGNGSTAAAAMKTLITEFADDAPYPEGKIRVEVPAGALSFPDVPAATVDAATDGGMLIDDVLRGASMLALAVGVVGGLLGQAEVAIPAFMISGVLAGAAASFELADRLQHGDFEWDLTTAMNLLDIAAALLTVGMASGATAAVRGVGSLRLVGQLNKGVGVMQIGIQAGVHFAAIAAAVKSGDNQRIIAALGQALAAGALFLVVHKASSNLGGSVDEALTKAAGSRTNTGGVDPEGMAKIMNDLPVVPVDQSAMRAFAAESVGLGAGDVTLMNIAGGVGEGVSGAPVFLVQNAKGEIVGALKIFPKAEEFIRELSSLQKLGTMKLTFGQGVSAKGVARTSIAGGQGGMLVSSAAEGQALNRMMGAAAAKAGPARTSALADLRAAIVANARTLSRLHSAGPPGEVSASYIQRHVDAVLDITQKLEAQGPKLKAVDFDPIRLRPRVNELITGIREHPGGSSVVHGDAHPGNFFYDPATGITMIDTPTLHYSLDAKGNPIGAPGRDIANFGQKLANFGKTYGLTAPEIAELQTAFSSNYQEAGGGPSTPQADAFFRARTALGELIRATTDTATTQDGLRAQADAARDALGLAASGAH